MSEIDKKQPRSMFPAVLPTATGKLLALREVVALYLEDRKDAIESDGFISGTDFTWAQAQEVLEDLQSFVEDCLS